MGLPAFDTHAFVKRLKLVGFSDEQAEAQADLQSEVLSSLMTEKLATKEYIKHLDEKINKLDVKCDGKFSQLYWMLGFLLAANMTVLYKLFHM